MRESQLYIYMSTNEEILNHATQISQRNKSGKVHQTGSGILSPQLQNLYRVDFEDAGDPTIDLQHLSMQVIEIHLDVQNYIIHAQFEQPAIDGNTFIKDLCRLVHITITGLDDAYAATYKIKCSDCTVGQHDFGHSYCRDDAMIQSISWNFVQYEMVDV